MITKSREQDIDRAGKRLLRGVLESLGWVINDVQEDFGIDSNIQVFDGGSPTGAWFHVQLKSSGATDYSSERDFISQELSADHARHYGLELRQPVILIHVDVNAAQVFWHAPQLDPKLGVSLNRADAKSVTVRIPVSNRLPDTASALLSDIQKIHLALATRVLTSTSASSFAESLKHLPDQQSHYDSFQAKSAVLKLQRVTQLFHEEKLDEARMRASVILDDPDPSIEVKFWAAMTVKAINWTQAVHAGKPQSECAQIALSHAKFLRKLTRNGPAHLKFFAVIDKQAAQLAVLVHESYSLHLAYEMHVKGVGNPMLALGLYARRLVLTKLVVRKYNQCVRLARYASTYRERWVLGRALGGIVNAVAGYIITLGAEGNIEARDALATSAFQICKTSAWISQETGDFDGIIMAILSALTTVRSQDTEAFRWADEVSKKIPDSVHRQEAEDCIARAVSRWQGESVQGDYVGDPVWQVIQNMASALGVDVANENDPLVRGLKIAAKDDSPARILENCEHLFVTIGATGPIARLIHRLFNLQAAASKVIHCTLHELHGEGRELDAAFAEFKRLHCDTCPDKKPRPKDWNYTDQVRIDLESKNMEFVRRLAGTKYDCRYTAED